MNGYWRLFEAPLPHSHHCHQAYVPEYPPAVIGVGGAGLRGVGALGGWLGGLLGGWLGGPSPPSSAPAPPNPSPPQPQPTAVATGQGHSRLARGLGLQWAPRCSKEHFGAKSSRCFKMSQNPLYSTCHALTFRRPKCKSSAETRF